MHAAGHAAICLARTQQTCIRYYIRACNTHAQELLDIMHEVLDGPTPYVERMQVCSAGVMH